MRGGEGAVDDGCFVGYDPGVDNLIIAPQNRRVQLNRIALLLSDLFSLF